jgi:hypothetical protein
MFASFGKVTDIKFKGRNKWVRKLLKEKNKFYSEITFDF